ncbi:hypothetical protein POM88_026291 [Heracleum sosnowskyi]|nr:hypothetical protein POM88_026291 [Heracleum sosnowskyi]
MLVFKIKEVSHQEDLSRVGHWRMHEYSLCGINKEIPNQSNTVLCKITLDHSKEPAIELHSDGTTVKVDVKMDAVEQCYETDSVQTCDKDDVEQKYSIYDGCTCADDELVWYNSLFVSGEDGNYETDSVQTCNKDDVEEIHSTDDGCTCADDDLDCFKLKHRMCYGPCQTPTLGFCVHPYIIYNGYELKLEWERGRLFDADVAEMFRGLIVDDGLVEVTGISEKQETKVRPSGLNTVNLLKVASSSLGFGPQLAMQLAERLYTQGFISYPRTESTAYPSSFDFRGALEVLRNNSVFGNDVQKLLADGYIKPRSGTDVGDHPPITPMRSASEDMLGYDAWRVYQYVCQHFLGTLSPDCKFIRGTLRLQTTLVRVS